MSTETNPLLSRVLNARNRLMASGLYLADPSITANVLWLADTTNETADETAHETADKTADETDPKENTESTVDDPQDPHNVSPNPGLPPRPERAILSAIACIDHDDFWLVADGGYHGPTEVCKEILDIKPSCAMTHPGLEPVRTDFAVVLQNLREITQKCVTSGYSAGRSFFTWSNQIPTRFKLRHQLFEGDDDDHDGVPTPDSPSEDAFTFQQWPLTRERHRAELLTLKSTHRLLPVPAYDLEGNLLKPSTYRRYLQGALVEIHFTLSHWGIAGAKRDVYGGEIELIRLLEPPRASSAPVQKRKLPLHLDTDDGPAKKRAAA
ncbi:hypothetical protein EDD15DRAFT_2202033 [Pisolithus albus]|nr:hypothetical protein EDD15DRAFT_2202033 [Pisolithus albus]